MKKIILSATLLSFTVLGLQAQNAKVVSTYNYLRYGELDKAQEAIDAASKDATTSESSKTWYYRGNVYRDIYMSTNPAYKALSSDPLTEAIDSYLKAYTLDMKKIDVDDMNKSLKILGYKAFDEGVKNFSEKNFPAAVGNFEKSMKITKKFGGVDSIAIYNAGLAAEKGKLNDKAMQYFRKSIEIGYKGTDAYFSLIKITRDKMAETPPTATDQELFAIITEARAKYPNNQALITEEINYFLLREEHAKAKESLKLALEKDPNNAMLWYVTGNLYDNMANPKEKTPEGKQIDKPKPANYDELMVEAEKHYLKAIELDGKYFDAVYSLGALYFNQGADYNNKIQEIKDNVKYKAEKEKADAIFKKAIPFLEKAHEIDPTDQTTMWSLKNLYSRVNDTAKYEAMKAKMGN